MLTITASSKGQDDSSAQGSNDYNVQHNDGSFEFGYDTKDHFHHADGTKANFVRGQFGSRNPGTGTLQFHLHFFTILNAKIFRSY